MTMRTLDSGSVLEAHGRPTGNVDCRSATSRLHSTNNAQAGATGARSAPLQMLQGTQAAELKSCGDPCSADAAQPETRRLTTELTCTTERGQTEVQEAQGQNMELERQLRSDIEQEEELKLKLRNLSLAGELEEAHARVDSTEIVLQRLTVGLDGAKDKADDALHLQQEGFQAGDLALTRKLEAVVDHGDEMNVLNLKLVEQLEKATAQNLELVEQLHTADSHNSELVEQLKTANSRADTAELELQSLADQLQDKADMNHRIELEEAQAKIRKLSRHAESSLLLAWKAETDLNNIRRGVRGRNKRQRAQEEAWLEQSAELSRKNRELQSELAALEGEVLNWSESATAARLEETEARLADTKACLDKALMTVDLKSALLERRQEQSLVRCREAANEEEEMRSGYETEAVELRRRYQTMEQALGAAEQELQGERAQRQRAEAVLHRFGVHGLPPGAPRHPPSAHMGPMGGVHPGYAGPPPGPAAGQWWGSRQQPQQVQPHSQGPQACTYAGFPAAWLSEPYV